MKLVIFFIAIAALFWGLVVGINHILRVDDLAECAGPSLTVEACAPADAVVAISGGDTSARVTEAVSLYKAGWAPLLIFSGAALDRTGLSNAEAMRRQAIAAGVPSSVIVIEEESLDTADNALRTSALLGQGMERIIVVTSPYHQRRAGLEFTYILGNRVQVVNHPTPYDRLWPEYWWTTLHGWWLALAETVKTLVVMVKQ